MEESIEMSFLSHALYKEASACPDKSGHTCNANLNIMQHAAQCPDLSGPGTALCRGSEIKRDISMLMVPFLSCITMKRSVRVSC
jgi:hypothetical protein